MATPSQNPFASTKRAHRLRMIAIGSGVVLAVVVGIFFYTSSRRSAIRIPNPGSDSTITLNGKAVNVEQQGGDLYIPVYSGVYRLEIQRPQYAPFLSDVSVTAGHETIVRPVFTLLPSTQASAQSGIDYVRPSLDQRSLYYLGDDRTRLYRMEIANQVQIPLTERALSGVQDVQWSTSPDVALLVLDDGVYLQDLLKYNFETQDLVKIAGPELLSPVWDPTDSSRFAGAYFTDSGERSLIISDKKMTQVDRKADLKDFTNPKVRWSPDGRLIYVLNQSNDYSQNDLWVYSVTQATMTRLTTGGNILDALFNTDGTSILYEQLNGGDHTLRAFNLLTQKDALLPLAGAVSRVAWRDAGSLFVPGDNNDLQIVHTDSGAVDHAPYSFPDNLDIAGMYYYPQTQVLIFYTDNAVYTVKMGS